MQTIDELELLLRAWGRHFGERPARDELSEDDYAPDVHALAIGMRNAPGKRKTFVIQTLGRSARSRLTVMGAAAGMVDARGNVQMAPAWACDPVHFAETRRAVYGSGETARQAPPELQRVERVAFDLKAFDRLAGLCVRIEYCARGTRDEKAARVQATFGGDVGSRRYRESLAMGRGFMYARLI